MEIAKDPDLLGEAVDIFKKQARSSGDTSHFNLRTWIDFHSSVACWPRYGLPHDCPALPLTPTKIIVVGSVFKGAGYRSTGNYLSAIKRSHIAHGHDWSPQLELAADMFKASTERGIGPGKQSCPLPWGKLTTADLRTPFTAERFPLRVDLCVVIWVFFFMRELEAATAELADMTLDTSTCKVKLVMSVSKNDPRALGCTREWGCVCEDSRRPNARTCPYHAAAGLLHEVTGRFGQESRRPGFPLFPTSSGVAASAKVMLEVILVTAALLGEPLKNTYGQNRHGNHKWRALAAVLMATLGMDTNKIRMMGRWNCSIVLHYTRDAPLADMASDFKAARDQRRAPNQMKEMHTALKNVKKAVELASAGLVAELDALRTRLTRVERRATPEYVINRRTNNLHMILTPYADAGANAVACCGFEFASPGALVRFESELPADLKWEEVCSTCLPEVRARLKP